MRYFSSLLFLALCFVATDACANWQYTKWGMTKDQVAEASHGQAVALTPEERDGQQVSNSHMTVLLKAPYSSGQFNFTAYFRFDDTSGQLISVHLELADAEAKASELEGSLRSKYGKPDREDRGQFISSVQWYRDGDQVSFASLSPSLMVNLDYSPRTTLDNQGL